MDGNNEDNKQMDNVYIMFGPSPVSHK